MFRLLLVEDDASLGATLKERLQKEGYGVEWVKSKHEAGELCNQQGEVSLYDLIILDVGLPDGSGLDLARDLKMSRHMPIIFLSALSSAEYRLEGFELGAEDYIPKPFHLKELLLRIERVLNKEKQPAELVFPDFAVDLAAMAVVFRDGVKEFLQKRDFELLRFLIAESPRVLSRKEILFKVWRNESHQNGRSVDNAVMRLRQVLRRLNCECIRSVRGVGYQWVLPFNLSANIH